MSTAVLIQKKGNSRRFSTVTVLYISIKLLIDKIINTKTLIVIKLGTFSKFALR
jgi:hypothetical protein